MGTLESRMLHANTVKGKHVWSKGGMSAADSGWCTAPQASKGWHLFAGLRIDLAAQLVRHSLAQGEDV